MSGEEQEDNSFHLCRGDVDDLQDEERHCLQQKVLSSPGAIVFKTISLLKSWLPMLKQKLRPPADEALNLMSMRAS